MHESDNQGGLAGKEMLLEAWVHFSLQGQWIPSAESCENIGMKKTEDDIFWNEYGKAGLKDLGHHPSVHHFSLQDTHGPFCLLKPHL
jgi:hypothetical protein